MALKDSIFNPWKQVEQNGESVERTRTNGYGAATNNVVLVQADRGQ